MFDSSVFSLRSHRWYD